MYTASDLHYFQDFDESWFLTGWHFSLLRRKQATSGRIHWRLRDCYYLKIKTQRDYWQKKKRWPTIALESYLRNTGILVLLVNTTNTTIRPHITITTHLEFRLWGVAFGHWLHTERWWHDLKTLFLLEKLKSNYMCSVNTVSKLHLYSTQNRCAWTSSAPGTGQKRLFGFFTVRWGSYAKIAASARPQSFTSLINIDVAVEVCRINVAKDNGHGEIPHSA